MITQSALLELEAFVSEKKTVCAWCQKEQGIKPEAGQSHGICKRHQKEFLAQVEQLNQKP